MSRFAQRSYQKEILDQPGIPEMDIRENMEELNTINTFLGGHGCTVKGLKKALKGIPVPNRKILHVCEVGCGGGDNLRVAADFLRKKGIPARFTGIDINSFCIETARKHWKNGDTHWICCDYKEVIFTAKPDIIFSSLFCHHLDERALDEHFQWVKKQAASVFFINDLHRHFLAYYSIKVLTRFFSNSYLVKNDAPVSVLRGFRKKEWIAILHRNGIHSFKLNWHFAFRWLVFVSFPKT